MLNYDKTTFCSRTLAIAFFASLLFAFSAEAAITTIYIWQDDDGVRQYAYECPTGERCRVKDISSFGPKRQQKWYDRVAATAESTCTTSTDTTAPFDGSTTSTSTCPVANGTADLAWDPVIDASLSGYRVFYSIAGAAYQALDAGNATTYAFTALDSGTRYYFRVAAYDAAGNQSDFSNEVYKDMP